MFLEMGDDDDDEGTLLVDSSLPFLVVDCTYFDQML